MAEFGEREVALIKTLGAQVAAQRWVIAFAIGHAYQASPEGLGEIEAACFGIDDRAREAVVGVGSTIEPGTEAMHQAVLDEIAGIFRIARGAAGIGPPAPKADRG